MVVYEVFGYILNTGSYKTPIQVLISEIEFVSYRNDNEHVQMYIGMKSGAIIHVLNPTDQMYHNLMIEVLRDK